MASLAHPARLAVEGALYRGRYGINTDSHAAPQPDPRPRREVSAHRAHYLRLLEDFNSRAMSRAFENKRDVTHF